MHVWLKGSLLLLFVGLAFLCFLSHVSDWHVWNWSKAQVVNHGLASSHVWVKVDLPNLFVSIVEFSSEANNQSLSWGQSEQTSRENRLPKVPTVSWQFSCSYLILGDKHMTRSGFRPDTVRQRIGGEGCTNCSFLDLFLETWKVKCWRSMGLVRHGKNWSVNLPLNVFAYPWTYFKANTILPRCPRMTMNTIASEAGAPGSNSVATAWRLPGRGAHQWLSRCMAAAEEGGDAVMLPAES